MKGRITNIKRYKTEGLTFLYVSIAGTKQFNVDDFVEIKKIAEKKKKRKQKKPTATKKAEYQVPYWQAGDH